MKRVLLNTIFIASVINLVYSQVNNMEITPLSKIPVMVGGDEVNNACKQGVVYGLKESDFLAVRDGYSIKYQKNDSLYNGNKVWFCDKKDKWIGIVYGKNCDVDKIISVKKEYEGSCKVGWSYHNWLKPISTTDTILNDEGNDSYEIQREEVKLSSVQNSEDNSSFNSLDQSCNSGDKGSCLTLASLYFKIDEKKAIFYFEKACENGDGQICQALGNSYFNGEEVIEQDKEKAIEFYKKSCNLNNAEGCFSLGVQYFVGEILEKDSAMTANLYQKSCDLGSYTGCSMLGAMYYDGEGVERNFFKAYEFLLLGCEHNIDMACELLPNLKKILQYKGDGEMFLGNILNLSKDINQVRGSQL